MDTTALCGAVTGIGSLPGKDAAEAVRCVQEFSPQIPFWPQLPQRSEKETVIRQGIGILADLLEPRAGSYGYRVDPRDLNTVVARLHGGSGMLDGDHAAGFRLFESALESGLFPEAVAVKGQIEGPVSLCTYLYAGDQPFLASRILFEAVSAYIARVARWQIERLRQWGHPVMLFIDEPALCLYPSVAAQDPVPALRALFAGIRESGALAGLHCCARQPFGLMCRASPDILSFDAHQGLESFLHGKESAAFLESGGMVAYGLVPTLASLDGVTAEMLFSRWLGTVSQSEDPRRVARQAMITASCGLGLLSEEAAAASFRLAHQVGRMVRELAHG